MRSIHCIRAAVAAMGVACAQAGFAQVVLPSPSRAGETPPSSFTVFVRSVPVGAEQISVTRSADGWLISSSGRLGAPFDVSTRRLQVRYTPDWKPIELTLDAVIKGQTESLHTTMNGPAASTEIVSGAQT